MAAIKPTATGVDMEGKIDPPWVGLIDGHPNHWCSSGVETCVSAHVSWRQPVVARALAWQLQRCYFIAQENKDSHSVWSELVKVWRVVLLSEIPGCTRVLHSLISHHTIHFRIRAYFVLLEVKVASPWIHGLVYIYLNKTVLKNYHIFLKKLLYKL